MSLTTTVPVKSLDGVRLHPSVALASSREHRHHKDDLRWYAKSLGCVRYRAPLR